MANVLDPVVMPFGGRILSDEDGLPIPAATVHVDRGNGNLVGTTANDEGFYYFDEGQVGESVFVRAVGRETLVFDIPREPNMFYTHRLRSNAMLDEVEIFGDKPRDPMPWGIIGGIAAVVVVAVALADDAPKEKQRRWAK